MATQDKANKQLDDPTTDPQLLSPVDDNPDPTPLLTTLARVALAIARRRRQAEQQGDDEGCSDERP